MAGTKAAAGSGGLSTPTTTAGNSAAGAGVAGSAGIAAISGSGGAATAGAGGTMAPPSGADFPKTDAVNTDQMGPHKFDKYTDGLNSPTYSSAIVYYPTDATPPFASIVFSPGYTATKEDYENFLGPLFASHGIVILLTSPTSTSDQPPARADDLEAAMKQIDAENTREGSPLKGKLALDRKCISGQSMGGGGTCIAANRLADKIKCALPYEPWEPGMTFPMIKAPVMFIAAQSDTIAAVAQNAKPFYMSVPETTHKYYVEFTGASHFLTTGDQGTNYGVQSKYIIAFFKAYAEDDTRYMDVLNAPMDKELSDYEHSK
jgi:predicted dienelactone hydrolase